MQFYTKEIVALTMSVDLTELWKWRAKQNVPLEFQVIYVICYVAKITKNVLEI